MEVRKDYAVQMHDITIRFGAYTALDKVQLDVKKGSTADHGNDPTHTGTDHTRERVPFIAYSPSMAGCGRLEDMETFAVIGATIAENFGVDMPEGTIGKLCS